MYLVYDFEGFRIMIEKQFCEELQELLDRYKAQLPVPTIMRNAQKIFHNTLSFRVHPELHQETLEKTLKEFYEEDYDRAKSECQCIDEI